MTRNQIRAFRVYKHGGPVFLRTWKAIAFCHVYNAAAPKCSGVFEFRAAWRQHGPFKRVTIEERHF